MIPIRSKKQYFQHETGTIRQLHPGTLMKKISHGVLILFVVPFVLAAQIPAPENEPAGISFSGRSLVIRYHQDTIFSVQSNIDAAKFQYRIIVERTGDAVTQTLLMTTNDWNRKIRLQGIVKTS